MTRRSSTSSRRAGQDSNPFAALKTLKPRPGQAPTAAPAQKRAGEPMPEIDDRTLFRRAIGDVTPIGSGDRAEVKTPPPPPEPLQHRMDDAATLEESLAFPFSFEDRLDSGEEAAFLRPGLHRRLLVDLRRSRWAPQDKIDLHGLNREEAHKALSSFIATALAQGKRCIRVIHGKGLGSPGGVSILRQLSSGWLAQREEILAFCQANPHEGGAGALLVLLRAPGAKRAGRKPR